MAWRTLEHDGTVWNVSCAAERRGGTATWSLVLAFRPSVEGVGGGGPRPRALWAPYPLESGSQATLFQQADRIGTDELRALLVAAAAAAAAVERR